MIKVMPGTDAHLIQGQNTSFPSQNLSTITDVGSNSSEDQTILDVLLAEKQITPQQFEDIKIKSNSTGTSYEEILQTLHIIPEEKISAVKAQLLGVPYISLANTAFAPEAISFLSRGVAERFHVMPFAYDEKTQILSVAMANPVDLEAMQFIRQKTGLTIKAFAASPGEITHAIATQYRQELVGEVGKALEE